MSRYSEAFIKWVRKADAALVKQVLQDKGVDISSHRPEDLQVIDRSLGPRFREMVRRNRTNYEASTSAIGCYLGEVLARNLGARCHVPTYRETLAALLLSWMNPDWTERHVYLLLGA